MVIAGIIGGILGVGTAVANAVGKHEERKTAETELELELAKLQAAEESSVDPLLLLGLGALALLALGGSRGI